MNERQWRNEATMDLETYNATQWPKCKSFVCPNHYPTGTPWRVSWTLFANFHAGDDDQLHAKRIRPHHRQTPTRRDHPSRKVKRWLFYLLQYVRSKGKRWWLDSS